MQIYKKIGVIVLAMCFQGALAWAASQKSEDQKVWNSYIDTKKSFEKDVHNLVIDKWPKEKFLAQSHLNLELARLSQKDAQFDYIVKNNSERIDRNKGLNDFADFDWSDKDEKTLTYNDKSYAKQSREVARLDKQYNQLDGRSDFEKHLTDVKGTVEYRSIEDRYHDMVAKLETTWKNIKRDLKN
jgi:hypothetical protein